MWGFKDCVVGGILVVFFCYGTSEGVIAVDVLWHRFKGVFQRHHNSTGSSHTKRYPEILLQPFSFWHEAQGPVWVPWVKSFTSPQLRCCYCADRCLWRGNTSTAGATCGLLVQLWQQRMAECPVPAYQWCGTDTYNLIVWQLWDGILSMNLLTLPQLQYGMKLVLVQQPSVVVWFVPCNRSSVTYEWLIWTTSEQICGVSRETPEHLKYVSIYIIS